MNDTFTECVRGKTMAKEYNEPYCSHYHFRPKHMLCVGYSLEMSLLSVETKATTKNPCIMRIEYHARFHTDRISLLHVPSADRQIKHSATCMSLEFNATYPSVSVPPTKL